MAQATRISLGTAYTLLVAILALVSVAPSHAKTPLTETPNSSIGYKTVADALKDVQSKSGIVFSKVRGWLIATDEQEYTVWSFAPADYPAYPAVVKRQAIAKGAGSVIEMKVLCEADKAVCDDLVRTFARMNGMNVSD